MVSCLLEEIKEVFAWNELKDEEEEITRLECAM